MKNLALLIPLSLLLTLLPAAAATQAPTPFTYQFLNGDGTPNTNVAVMTAYPAAQQTITVVGTNIVYGQVPIVLTNFLGYGTNQAMPNQYQVMFTNLGYGFLVNILATTNTLPLSAYVVSAPVVYQASSFYGFLTNGLGFAPAPATPAGIFAALGYTPPTNTYSALTNALGFVPATNPPVLITTNIAFVGPNTTNTLYVTNSVIQRMSTP